MAVFAYFSRDVRNKFSYSMGDSTRPLICFIQQKKPPFMVAFLLWVLYSTILITITQSSVTKLSVRVIENESTPRGNCYGAYIKTCLIYNVEIWCYLKTEPAIFCIILPPVQC